MRTALLDVNVLLALSDEQHAAHEKAHAWARENTESTWASCAITQNGFVRILSQPQYPGRVEVSHAIELLHNLTRSPHHVFWPCTVQLTDELIHAPRLLGARQITDTYLLALAVHHNGALVTFDTRISLAAVSGATDRHLVVL